MEIVEKRPVPIYEVECFECKSKIRYKASEVSWLHITCPVCGVSLWTNMIAPVAYQNQEVDDYERNMLHAIPAADVKPVARGEWLEHKLDGLFLCSKCKSVDLFGASSYCPNCGADMRGDNNDA